ncbi:uncharacterized protein LOC124371633 [Homalodisca vitripennis]|uniref:uncharacterized protein LOC124371633 n=1 Tax=Homalodisca vitripennis TaxID=197043 RepID=UPI001EEA295D|nr:uncharacterized protein LOC124371633 [Homalodisca vitripennis]
MGYKKPRLIFSAEQEKQLSDYAVQAAKIFYGISPKEMRNIAFEFAIANKVPVPENWVANRQASNDWFTKFMQRNENVSIRVPEATSLSRSTSFNKHNVDLFFQNLELVLNQNKFTANDIWNIDETGTGTVQKPVKIIAQKGEKRVGGMTSAERGTNVTMVLAVNAEGNSVPPMFVFPRKFYKDHFVRDGPVGCCGTANPSGWITGPDFLFYMKHFVKKVRCSKESPVLVLLDNHSAHLHIDVLDYCKENGITLLSFPPHTTNRLQPLDVSVFGPFKKLFNDAMCGWMKCHPGNTVSIYDIPTVVRTALPKAATPSNIQAGFRSTGIWEFNKHIFTEEDFLCSSVTDRPLNSPIVEVGQCEVEEGRPRDDATIREMEESQHHQEPQPSTSYANQPCPFNAQVLSVSPMDIRPLPKAGPRKSQKRKSLKSAILTSTPVKENIRIEEMERQCKPSEKRDTMNKPPWCIYHTRWWLTNANDSVAESKNLFEP